MSNGRGINVSRVAGDMQQMGNLKRGVLNQVRVYLFKKATAYKEGKITIQQLVDEVMKFASFNLEKGVITQDDVVTEIAKIIKDVNINDYVPTKEGKSR